MNVCSNTFIFMHFCIMAWRRFKFGVKTSCHAIKLFVKCLLVVIENLNIQITLPNAQNPYSHLLVKMPFLYISNSVYCRTQAMCNLRIIQIKPFCSYVTLQKETNGGKIRNSVVIIGDRKIGVGFPAGTWFFSSVWCPDQIEAHPSCCSLTATAGSLLCFKAKLISHVHPVAKVMKEWR
jgi:hypothetical protein